MRRSVLFTLLALGSICALLTQRDVALAQTTGEVRPRTELSLEIKISGLPAGYHSIPGRGFGGRYRRLPDWQPRDGLSAPPTLELSHLPEGEAVRVRVSGLVGRFLDRVIPISDFLLREGERRVVADVRDYGYEPFEVAVVRVVRNAHAIPSVISHATSVEPRGAAPRDTDFPSYEVSLRNLSDKDLLYLEIHVTQDGRGASIQWLRDPRNRPLIRAGAVGKFVVWGGSRGQKVYGDRFLPSSPDTVEIMTVVFADESYEGKTLSAAQFLGGLRGLKAQLPHALAIFDAALESQTSGVQNVLENFKRRVEALSREADPATADALLARFTTLAPADRPRVNFFIEGGMNHVRKELLGDLQRFETESGREPDAWALRDWLSRTRQAYAEWLTRL